MEFVVPALRSPERTSMKRSRDRRARCASEAYRERGYVEKIMNTLFAVLRQGSDGSNGSKVAAKALPTSEEPVDDQQI